MYDMKKTLFFLLIMISLENFSQEEQEGVPFAEYSGWDLEALLTTQFSKQPSNSTVIPFYGMGIYPRYNYSLVDYFSVGFGTPINGGIDASSSSYGSYFKFFTDIPLEVTLNFGSKATKKADYLFGTFFGGGLDYNYSVFSDSYGYRASIHSFGPLLSAGIRYKYFGRPLGIRISYMSGVINNIKEDPSITYYNGTTPKILTLSLAYGVQ